MSSSFECSLLVPCYNVAEFLPRLFDSIEDQKTSFAEVLFYDDGSTDRTVAILKEHGYRVIVGTQNQGVSHARNQLLQAASCDWIHFHDADDLMSADFLNSMSQRIKDPESVYLCQSDWLDADHGNVQMHWRYDQEALDTDALTAVLKKPVSTINAIYPKKILDVVQGFNESVSCWEDADLHIRLAEKGYTFKVLDRVLVQALRRTNSSSARQSECEECRFKLLQSYEQRLDVKYQSVIAEEYEQTARRAVAHRNYSLVREAVNASYRMGGDPPSSASSIIQILKWVLPAYWVFRLQSLLRA